MFVTNNLNPLDSNAQSNNTIESNYFNLNQSNVISAVAHPLLALPATSLFANSSESFIDYPPGIYIPPSLQHIPIPHLPTSYHFSLPTNDNNKRKAIEEEFFSETFEKRRKTASESEIEEWNPEDLSLQDEFNSSENRNLSVENAESEAFFPLPEDDFLPQIPRLFNNTQDFLFFPQKENELPEDPNSLSAIINRASPDPVIKIIKVLGKEIEISINDFANKIKSYRGANSQQEFAKFCNLKESRIPRWEAEESYPKERHLIRICKKINKTIEYFSCHTPLDPSASLLVQKKKLVKISLASLLVQKKKLFKIFKIQNKEVKISSDNFGEKIKRFRLRLPFNISQIEFAESIGDGITGHMIQKYESQRHLPKKSIIIEKI
ncbi:MAG: helix-turn-helix transcriptional regulator, partial [Chlamydiota bacterium]